MFSGNVYRWRCAGVHKPSRMIRELSLLTGSGTRSASPASKMTKCFAPFESIMSRNNMAQVSLSNALTLRSFNTGRTSCQRERSSHEAEHVDNPAPVIDCSQGIQGSDYAKFQLWLDNCTKFRLSHCEADKAALKTGQKTLSQVIREQDELICRIADGLNSSVSEQSADNLRLSTADMSSQQGIQPSFGGMKTPLLSSLLAVENPCPEGTQESDCERFQEYITSCRQYKFSDCEQQLRDVQAGRKTIGDILQERDELLQAIVNYRNEQLAETTSEVDSTQDDQNTPVIDESKLSQVQRLKRAMKEYGSVVIVFHVCISILSLGAFYMAVSSGFDMVGLIERTGLMTEAFSARILAGTSTFVVAYAIHKLFVPVRMAITLASTPFIVRHLRRIGFLKPPK